ncbi:MAG: hypothetical protein IPF52_14365 [Saprospiraceae bacterium]|nr:hypothetical protein [Saprospiraceae bacterium]
MCGGTKTFTWNFTDQCNNAITHTQNITVTPIAPPAFVNPPGNLTIACNGIGKLPVSRHCLIQTMVFCHAFTDGNVFGHHKQHGYYLWRKCCLYLAVYQISVTMPSTIAKP